MRVKKKLYLIIFSYIVGFLSIFIYVLHLFLLDFRNVLINITGLNLSNTDDFLLFSGQIAILVVLLIILGLSIAFLLLRNTYLKGWKKILYYISLVSSLSFLIISIIISYDIAKMFFEVNPIDIINHYPSDTLIYSYRTFMLILFVIMIVVLNLGLSIFIHKFVIKIKTEAALLVLLFFLGFLINLLPAMKLFNIS